MLICLSALHCCKEVQLGFCTLPKIQRGLRRTRFKVWGKVFVGSKPVCLSALPSTWWLSYSKISPVSTEPCVTSALPDHSLLSYSSKFVFLELGLFVKWSILHCLEPGWNSWNPIVCMLLLQKAQFTWDELFRSNIFFPVYFSWQIFCFPRALSHQPIYAQSKQFGFALLTLLEPVAYSYLPASASVKEIINYALQLLHLSAEL